MIKRDENHRMAAVEVPFKHVYVNNFHALWLLIDGGGISGDHEGKVDSFVIDDEKTEENPNGKKVRPTQKQLDDKVKELDKEWEDAQYKRNRIQEYPTAEELAVAMYDADDKAEEEERRRKKKKEERRTHTGIWCWFECVFASMTPKNRSVRNASQPRTSNLCAMCRYAAGCRYACRAGYAA